jgi:D-sedoheptulose 7-phosphate isomerase
VLNDVVTRDGEIGSPRSLAELRLAPGAAEVVAELRAAGFRVFAVTNQPDVARGLVSSAASVAIMDAVRSAVGLEDARVCPHDEGDGCACRKPLPGMIRELAYEWGVDLTRSYVVGDRWRDVGAGHAAGCTTVLLRRPYNAEVGADVIVETLRDAARVMLTGDGAGARTHASRYLAEAAEIARRLDAEALEAMAAALHDVRAQGGRLFFLGVGGSASNASHAANDFRKIAGFEAYCATDNVAELTARVNDEGWSRVFTAYLEGSRLRGRDGVFVLSVGGGDAERNISANLVEAVRFAKRVGARVFGIVGRDGGHTGAEADHCIVVPVVNAGAVTAHTESFQAVLSHLLVTHPRLQRGALKWETESAAVPVVADTR